MAELLDIYDKNRNKTGKIIERVVGQKLEKGEFIVSIQCWIINLEGKILLTRRNFNKSHGGMWEPTGGLVTSGEDSLTRCKKRII